MEKIYCADDILSELLHISAPLSQNVVTEPSHGYCPVLFAFWDQILLNHGTSIQKFASIICLSTYDFLIHLLHTKRNLTVFHYHLQRLVRPHGTVLIGTVLL